MEHPHRRSRSSPRPFTARARLAAWSASLAALGLSPSSPGAACPIPASDEEIWIEFGGGVGSLLRVFVGEIEGGGKRCSAWLSIALSDFPSVRVAPRPADVVRSMRDVVEKVGASECEVAVVYENDTRDEIPPQELCVREAFRFEGSSTWSSSREGPCFEPEDFGILE